VSKLLDTGVLLIFAQVVVVMSGCSLTEFLKFTFGMIVGVYIWQVWQTLPLRYKVKDQPPKP